MLSSTLPAEATLLNAKHDTEGRSKGLRPREREGAGTREREGVVQLTIREGRNRQVRRMLEAVGHPVRELARTRIGPLTDRRLKVGTWRDLTKEEVTTLQALANRPAPTPPPRRPRPAAVRPRSASAR